MRHSVLLPGSEFKRNAINTKLASIFEIVWIDNFGDDAARGPKMFACQTPVS